MADELAASPVVEAVSDLVIANETRNVETAIIIENVIEHAEQRVEEAEKVATQITEAALEGERGRRIGELEEKSWRLEEDVKEFRQDMEALRLQLSEVMQGLSALTALQISSPTTTELSSSILPTSEGTVSEAITDVTEIMPANLANVVDENPVPVPPVPARRKRWI